MIRIGQLGVGYWGKNLLRNFAGLEGCAVTAVFDPKVEAVERAKGIAPGVPILGSDEELITSPDVDAVAIAAPAVLHAELALRALAAGKHVYVEKPMATALPAAERMVQAAAKAGKVLMVGHLLEYHPVYVKAAEVVASGALGDVHYVYSTRLNLGRVRTDESAMWSLAPHDVSVALMLMNGTPVSVSATGICAVQEGVEDVAFMAIRFGDGTLVHCHTSWLDANKARRMTVVGSRKMMIVDDMEPEEKIRVFDKGIDREAWDGNATGIIPVRDGNVEVVPYDATEPLKVECQAFLESVRTGVPPRSDGLDGLRVVSVLDGAERSLKSGGAPIELKVE